MQKKRCTQIMKNGFNKIIYELLFVKELELKTKLLISS